MMIRTPHDENAEEEIPITPAPDSSVSDIFSRKKIFFINSSFSGNRRSEIPNISSDYCPRDQVNRRLFNDRSSFCECNNCWRCLRRNKKRSIKTFLIVINIVLVVLLFMGLYKSFSVYKGAEESLGKESKSKWMSHDHYYDLLGENKLHVESLKGSKAKNHKPRPPVPVYEAHEDYDFHDDAHKYSIMKSGREKVELLPKTFLDKLNLNLVDEPLIIYDNREPKRVKRETFSKSKRGDLLNKLDGRFVKRSKYGAVMDEVNDALKGLEKFKEIFGKNRQTVFQPFSLTTPVYYTPLQSDEYSIEENDIEEELKNKFLETFTPTAMENAGGGNEELVGRQAEQNALIELLGFTVGGRAEEGEPRNREVHPSVHPFIPNENIFYTTDYPQDSTESLEKMAQGLHIASEEDTPDGLKITPEPTATETYKEKSGVDAKEAYSNDYRTFPNIPLIHVSLPFAGLFGPSEEDHNPTPPEKSDRVKGISLAEAKERTNNKRKNLLLHSRVVGGSSDVRLPTGPDFSKPLVNAFETLKTNQQLSFTPSAASQYILPYQICFFAGPFQGFKPNFQNPQPRTFSYKPPILLGGDSPPIKNHPPLTPPQNFLSFNINNYANPPPFRQQSFPSGSSSFNFPPQYPFPNIGPFPNKQPIFCTYLQPPLFQFPTVPGTADFSHGKCTDCEEDSSRKAFYLGRGKICSGNNIPCRDRSSCIPFDNWCDNEVHCKDASDEAFCSCRDRLTRERLCDGYVDCPHGEDEVGCFVLCPDCPKSAFSCDSLINPDSCISMSKRCDGLRDCSTGADESECSAIFFHMRQNDSYHVSQTNGYLHRNWKGDWFPVCAEVGDNSWAKEACSEELGFLPEEVDVSYQPVPGNYKGPFIVRREDNTPFLQNHCKGHVATYVKCPSMKCGTRVKFPNLQEFNSRFRRFIQNEILIENVPFVTWWNNLKNETKNFPVKAEEKRLKREETRRVVGGRESEPRAWPWAIALYKDGAFHCGGVILDERWVLTAAHCMEQYWNHFFEVRGGMLRRFSFSAMEQVRLVTHVIIHENYNPTIMSNDIAVLRLQEPFHFNRWVRPACLPSLDDGLSKFVWGPLPGTRCIAVGWGALRERGSDPDQLREVEVPILNRCRHKEDLAGAEICAGKVEGGKDTCQGDSGGPLLCRDSGTPSSWYVAGIVSHGEGCARPGEPGAYTRISLFIDWITTNTNDYQLPPGRPLRSCPGFRCTSGSRLCIPIKWVCNGFTDCLEAEDEKNCSSSFLMSEIFGNGYPGRLKSVTSEDKKEEDLVPTSERESLADGGESKKANEDVPEISGSPLEETELPPVSLNEANPTTSRGEELEVLEELENNLSVTEHSVVEDMTTENPIPTGSEDVKSETRETSSEKKLSGSQEDKEATLTGLKSKEDTGTTLTSLESEEDTGTTLTSLESEEDTGTTLTSLESQEDTGTTSLENQENDNIISKEVAQETQHLGEDTKVEDNSEVSTRKDELTTSLTTEEELESSESPEVEAVEIFIPDQEVKNIESFEGELEERVATTITQKNTYTDHSWGEDETTLNPSSHSVQPRETSESVEEDFTTITSFTEESSTDGLTYRMREDTLEKKKSGARLEYFRCEDIVQTIPRKYRCDGNLNCEDGSDEENCSCVEKLLYSNPKLICDGRLDCADLSDEKGCSNCSADEFYCRMSRECVPLEERCDGLPKCRLEEDEKDCFALSTTTEVEFQITGEPTFHTKGLLMSNKNGVWALECQNKTTRFGASEAVKVCTGLGTAGYETYENKTLGKDCLGFEVTCTENLINSLENYGSEERGYFWPWNAFVYSDGNPICSAALLRPEWLLTSVYCFKNIDLQENYLVAKLGSKIPASKDQELGTELIRINGISHVPNSDMILLHLSTNATQNRFVRSIGVPYLFDSDPGKDFCVALGEKTVFLKMSPDCHEASRCYNKADPTSFVCRSKPWVGVIACQSRLGWFPSSVFAEKTGYCGFKDARFTSVQDKISDIQSAMDGDFKVYPEPLCNGVRCSDGFCLPPDKVCNGRPDCRFKEDEDPDICSAEKEKDCKFNELKCRNGRCIPKTEFGDGVDDCGDNSDEPANGTCLDYLRLTAPQRICDGRRNCYDKTDENPELCPCADNKFECKLSQGCVPKDFVCDGEMDCPLGEDEDYCVTRKTLRNRSEIMKNSFGLWHSVCFSGVSKKLSDALCQDLGFREALYTFEKNQTVLVPKIDAFTWVKLNHETSIGLRGDRPFARLVKARKVCTDVKCA